jgi:ferric-dicitrate binding protein FerR (iron transport regulator)
MRSRTWSRKSIAVSLSIAVFTVYSALALAAPGQTTQTAQTAQSALAGDLSVSGQVTVNGQNAISGATVFSDSTITTGPNSSAALSIGKLGRVELLPGSSMKVSFTANSLSGSLDAGRARVSTFAGASANIMTKDGSVIADASQPAAFSLDVECGNTQVATQTGVVTLRSSDKTQQVAAGQDASAGMPQTGTRCTRLTMATRFGHLTGTALAVLLLAAGGAVAAAILATRRNNNLNFGGGNVVVISPTA